MGNGGEHKASLYHSPKWLSAILKQSIFFFPAFIHGFFTVGGGQESEHWFHSCGNFIGCPDPFCAIFPQSADPILLPLAVCHCAGIFRQP
jgi:hypothetical protein